MWYKIVGNEEKDMKRTTGKKTGIMMGIIYLIAFGIFNMLVFFLTDERNNVFWTSYAFMSIAFVVQIVSMLLAFKSMEVESAFLGIPLASLSIYYFFAAIFVGAVFMFFQIAPFKLAFALQSIILGVYIIIAIISLFTRDVVQEVNDNIKESVTAMKVLNVDVDSILAMAEDPSLKSALKKLSETVKYSDPMSNEAVSEIEGEIMAVIDEIRIYSENGQNEEAIKGCKNAELLFLKRNKLLKATK